MRAKFPSFSHKSRGQLPGRRFDLRGPRTSVHGPIRLQKVRLFLSQSFRGQILRGQVKWRSGSRGHRRTTADNRGQRPFFAFLCLFSAAFSNCFVFSHILSLQWSLQYHSRRSHGECILRDDQAADVPETSFLLLQKL